MGDGADGDAVVTGASYSGKGTCGRRRTSLVPLQFGCVTGAMRTIWNGSISFGLVNIPIGLALATQRSDVAFRTLHRECGTPIKQKRWCPFHERDVEAGRARQGLGGREGRVRDRRGVRPRVGRAPALAVDRHPALRRARGRRPDVLRQDVLPRAVERRRGEAAVRAAAPRDAGDGHGRGRQVRALGQGEPLPHPRAGRHARAGDALLRRRRPLEGGDRGGRREHRAEEARARARRAR